MIAKLKHGIAKVKDPGNTLTHFIAMILAIIVVMPLLLKAGHGSGRMHVSVLAVFILSMIGLYAASTIHHTLDISPKINKLLRKIDHMMIFILIVGTYTPVCMIVLDDKTGWTMLTLVWGITIVGVLINALWVTCPKWFSSLIYIAVGWACILAITKILSSMPRVGFIWLLVGGIIYTVGGIIYAMKLPFFNSRHRRFGFHEIFHLFAMGGNLYHYVMMYRFIT